MPADRLQIDYDVLSRNADANARLSVRALVTMLFDAADLHATQWNVSLGQLSETDLTWVLSRMHVRLDRQPRWNEAISVETWPTGAMRLLAGRDFSISCGGEVIGRATTLWLMLHRESRKPVPLPDFIKEFEAPDGSPVVASRRKWPAPGDGALSLQGSVRWSDLDLNRHAAALSYLDWLLRPLPEKTTNACSMGELDILFKGEAFVGDEFNVAVSEIDRREFSHLATRASDGAVLAAARTRWQV